MARPRKKIDKKAFEKLCGLQCRHEEICDFFDITDKTLNAWCKRTYNANFSEVFRQKRGKGKIALRRSQFRLAEKNATMAIFLGKQYLDQKEPTTRIELEQKATDETIKEMRKYLAERKETDSKSDL